jgi:hypothetical protein
MVNIDAAHGMLGHCVHLLNETIPIRECDQRKKVECLEVGERGLPVVDQSIQGRQSSPSIGRNLDQYNDGCDLIKPTILRLQRSNTSPQNSDMEPLQGFHGNQHERSFLQPRIPVQAQRRASAHAALGTAVQQLHAMCGGERAITMHFGTPQTIHDFSSHDSPGRLAWHPTPPRQCYSMLDSRIDGSGRHYSSPLCTEKQNDLLWVGPLQTRATRRASIGCSVPSGYPPDRAIEELDPVHMLYRPGVRAARRASMECSTSTRHELNVDANETDRLDSVRACPRRAARRASIGCSTPSPCRDFDSSDISRLDALPTSTRARATRRASMEPVATMAAGPSDRHRAGPLVTKPSRRPMRRLSLGSITGPLCDSDASSAKYQQSEKTLSDPQRHIKSDQANQSQSSRTAEPPILQDFLFRQGMHLGTTGFPQACLQNSYAHPNGEVDARPATEKRARQRRKSLACTAAERPRVWV